MSFITEHCPHCDSERVAFRSVGESRHPHGGDFRTVFFSCGKCGRGICVETTPTPNGSGSPHSIEGGLKESGKFNLVRIYPKPKPPEVPEHVPDNIAKAFREARDIAKKSWALAGVGFRITIELAVESFIDDPAQLKKKLYGQIDHLETKRIITPALKDWAHEVRLTGNKGAHDTDGLTKDDVDDLDLFTELFLVHSFTLPERMRIRRENRKTPQASS